MMTEHKTSETSITTGTMARMTFFYRGDMHMDHENAVHSFIEVQWDQVVIQSNGVKATQFIPKGTKFCYLGEVIEQTIAQQRINNGQGQYIVKTKKKQFIDGNPTNPV
jgi:hypothetical protein